MFVENTELILGLEAVKFNNGDQTAILLVAKMNCK